MDHLPAFRLFTQEIERQCGEEGSTAIRTFIRVLSKLSLLRCNLIISQLIDSLRDGKELSAIPSQEVFLDASDQVRFAAHTLVTLAVDHGCKIPIFIALLVHDPNDKVGSELVDEFAGSSI